MTMSPFRNRESVIRAILRRERDGLPLNCEAVKEAYKTALFRGVSSLWLMA